jgi:hypothetical protein
MSHFASGAYNRQLNGKAFIAISSYSVDQEVVYSYEM